MLHANSHQFKNLRTRDETCDLIVATNHVHIDKCQVMRRNGRTPSFLLYVRFINEAHSISHLSENTNMATWVLYTTVQTLNVNMEQQTEMWIKMSKVYLLRELNDQGKLVGLDEGQQIFFADLSIKSIPTLIKLGGEEERERLLNQVLFTLHFSVYTSTQTW